LLAGDIAFAGLRLVWVKCIPLFLSIPFYFLFISFRLCALIIIAVASLLGNDLAFFVKTRRKAFPDFPRESKETWDTFFEMYFIRENYTNGVIFSYRQFSIVSMTFNIFRRWKTTGTKFRSDKSVELNFARKSYARNFIV